RRALGEDVLGYVRRRFELCAPRAEVRVVRADPVGQVHLAVHAPERARAAVLLGPRQDVGREQPVQVEDRADLGTAWVAAPDLLRIGDERPYLLADRLLVVREVDRVVERLAHLPTVRTRDRR